MSYKHSYNVCPKFMPDITYYNASPAQNTWYTIVPTVRNVRIYGMFFKVAFFAEDIEVELTIDGEVFTITVAGWVANAEKKLDMNYSKTATVFVLGTGAGGSSKAYVVEARSFSARMRKTTAAGASRFYACLSYGQY